MVAGVRPLAGTAGALLLERRSELERIEAWLHSVRDGVGAPLVVEGPAGIGKTALVAAAREGARAAGLRVLTAGGSELERDFPYGILRQLLEPYLAAIPADEREELMAGAAALAAPVLAPVDPSAESGGLLGALETTSRGFAVLHGLYWLCANATQREALVLAIDDGHWADSASLQFLGFLARRLAELPLGVVIATRTDEEQSRQEGVAVLAGDPSAEVLHLGPLSRGAVAAMLEAALDREPEQLFTDASYAVTRGTPFFVTELLRAVQEEGIEPIAADAGRVHALGPRPVARSVLARLRRLPPSSVLLAQSAAILGPDAALRHVAALADLELDAAGAAVDALATAGILEDARPIAFVHPIVRAAIHRDLTSGQRARLHARAAQLFRAEPGCEDRMATHLLATEPAADPWVVDALLAAARHALIQGAARSAVPYLRRALAEPPSAERRATVLLNLGFAESYDGDPDAAHHLDEALACARDRSAQIATTIALGRILQLAGHNDQAVDVYTRTLSRLAGLDSHDEMTIEGALVSAALLDVSTAAVGLRRVPDLRRRAEALPNAPPTVFGPLAFAAAGANEPAANVIALARRALINNDPLLPEAADRPPFFYYACAALIWAEAHDEAQRLLDTSLADAQRLASLPHFVGLSACRAWLGQRRGALADAEADARLSLSAGSSAPWFFLCSRAGHVGRGSHRTRTIRRGPDDTD